MILGCVLACVPAGRVLADDLTLSGGTARLSGIVRSINEAGAVELVSPLSPGPLLLKPGAVEKVEFSPRNGPPARPSAMIELANGDVLPAVVEGLDERKLAVVSPEAGRLEIPREYLKSMQLGVLQRKLIYAGPKGMDEWNAGDGESKSWTFDHDSLVANGSGEISKNLKLPQQFILRFSLKWQANPNFQIYFADPLKAKGEPSDRYFLRFSAAGLDIKRESSQGRRYTDILLLNRTPNQYPDRLLQVEIRVDRKGSRIQLFLNGEPEGVFVDPLRAVPVGSGIALASTAANGNSQEIRDIEILEYDDSRGRHRSEERGDPKSDSLISRDDDRWGGHLLEVRKTAEGTVCRFKSDFQNDPLELPEKDVSTVFFAAKDAGKPDGKAAPFVLRLRGDGSLRVASCRFTEESVSAVHPLLGPVDFLRDGILAMERADSKSKNASEP